MSRLTIDFTVQNADPVTDSVKVIPGAFVTVHGRNEDGTQGALSSVWLNPNPIDLTTITQPLVTDAQGRIPGWLDPGDYLLTTTAPGYVTYTLAYTVPYTFVEVEATTVLTGLTTGVETQVTLNMPGKACLLYAFEASVASRARIYATASQATADIPRSQNIDPVGNIGCLLEMVIIDSTAGMPWQLSPEVMLVEQEVSPTSVFPAVVRCDSGTSVTINVFGFIIEQ